MWPFRPRERQPWIEQALQRSHVVVLELERRIGSLEALLTHLGEGVATAKAIERRTGSLEMNLRQLASAQVEDVSRLTAALEVVRGQANGPRGGRPRNEEREADRQALELGRKFSALIATPEGRAQLVLELQAAGSVNALGEPIRNGSERNGSPV